MHDGMGRMTSGIGLFWLLILIVLVLWAAALLKDLLSGLNGNGRGRQQ